MPLFNFLRLFYFPNEVLDSLRKPIIQFIPFIDTWHLIHFASGFILRYIIGTNKPKKALFFIIGFELFEFFLVQEGLVLKESFMNMILDIIITFFGYKLADKTSEIAVPYFTPKLKGTPKRNRFFT